MPKFIRLRKGSNTVFINQEAIQYMKEVDEGTTEIALANGQFHSVDDNVADILRALTVANGIMGYHA